MIVDYLSYDSKPGDRVFAEAEPIKVEAEDKLSLVQKKCTPCSSKELQPMKKDSAESLLEQIPGWDLQEVDGQLQLKKSWKARNNFMEGLELIQSVAAVAESEGGLTENDFILAAKINTIITEGFLRKTEKKSAPLPPTEAT